MRSSSSHPSAYARDEIFRDLLIPRVGRFVWIAQASILVIGLILSLTKVFWLAILLAFVGLTQIFAALGWAWIRFGTFEVVKEKRHLERSSKDLQRKIDTYTMRIAAVQQRRTQLVNNHWQDLQQMLEKEQRSYIVSGMAAKKITDGEIPGIGQKLVERLERSGYSTAASINQYVSGVEGMGPVKTQALVTWRNQVFSGLDRTKPMTLSAEAKEQIDEKYQILFSDCDQDELRSKTYKDEHETSLAEVLPQLENLAPVKFRLYLRTMLGERWWNALLAGGLIVFSQLCIWPFSTVGALIDSRPTPTSTPTITLAPSFTFTSSITPTSTISNTPTITDTPTQTYTPTRTSTPTPSRTATRTKTRTPDPNQLLVVAGALNGNPWGYGFSGNSLIYSPPSNFCSYFPCIQSFWSGSGYVVQCVDGRYSKSGGSSGSCSSHGGVSRPLYQP